MPAGVAGAPTLVPCRRRLLHSIKCLVGSDPRMICWLIRTCLKQGRRVPRIAQLLLARIQLGGLRLRVVPERVQSNDRRLLLLRGQLVEHVRIVLLLVHEQAIGYLLLVQLAVYAPMVLLIGDLPLHRGHDLVLGPLRLLAIALLAAAGLALDARRAQIAVRILYGAG